MVGGELFQKEGQGTYSAGLEATSVPPEESLTLPTKAGAYMSDSSVILESNNKPKVAGDYSPMLRVSTYHEQGQGPIFNITEK